MELKLKAKEDRPNNAGVGIAESPKLNQKFFIARGCSGKESIFEKHPELLCFFGLVWEHRLYTNQIRQEVHGTPPNHTIVCYQKVDVYNFCNGKYLYSYEKIYKCPSFSFSTQPFNF
jgi:hypothetical protein